MPAFVKTHRDEKAWARAKKHYNQGKAPTKAQEDQWTDKDWGTITNIYKSVCKKYGGCSPVTTTTWSKKATKRLPYKESSMQISTLIRDAKAHPTRGHNVTVAHQYKKLGEIVRDVVELLDAAKDRLDDLRDSLGTPHANTAGMLQANLERAIKEVMTLNPGM